MPVTKVSTYAFVNPVIAVLIGVVTLGERLAPAEIFGMVIILISGSRPLFCRAQRQRQYRLIPLLEVPIEEQNYLDRQGMQG